MVIKERASGTYCEPDESIPRIPNYFFQIHFIITFPQYASAFEVGWLLQIFWPTLCRHFSCLTLLLQATPILLLDLIILMVFVEQYQLQMCFLCHFLQSPPTSSTLGADILLSTLFQNSPSFFRYCNVSDHVLQPYKTKGNILCLILTLQISTCCVFTRLPNLTCIPVV